MNTHVYSGTNAHSCVHYLQTHIYTKKTLVRWILPPGSENFEEICFITQPVWQCICHWMSLSLFILECVLCARMCIHPGNRCWSRVDLHTSTDTSNYTHVYTVEPLLMYFNHQAYRLTVYFFFYLENFPLQLVNPQSHKPLCPCPRQQPLGSHSSPHISPLFTQRSPLTATDHHLAGIFLNHLLWLNSSPIPCSITEGYSRTDRH